jgi:hypothetical protein
VKIASISSWFWSELDCDNRVQVIRYVRETVRVVVMQAELIRGVGEQDLA